MKMKNLWDQKDADGTYEGARGELRAAVQPLTEKIYTVLDVVMPQDYRAAIAAVRDLAGKVSFNSGIFLIDEKEEVFFWRRGKNYAGTQAEHDRRFR